MSGQNKPTGISRFLISFLVLCRAGSKDELTGERVDLDRADREISFIFLFIFSFNY